MNDTMEDLSSVLNVSERGHGDRAASVGVRRAVNFSSAGHYLQSPSQTTSGRVTKG